MIHLTLNTGHVAEHSDAGPPEVLALMQPLLNGGGLGLVAPELAAYRVDVTRERGMAAFTVLRGSEPIVLCVLCADAAAASAAWFAIEGTYLSLSDRHAGFMSADAQPEQPVRLPWLAVLLLPTIALQPSDAFDWLGDFERCLAWALLAEAEPS